MRMPGKLFSFLFMAIIAASWLIFPRNTEIMGYVEKNILPKFSLRGFLSGDYQKESERYFARRVPSLKLLLFLKNDIYDALNLGMFHSGYWGNILQGREGVLFERSYVEWHYKNIENKTLIDLAETTGQKLSTFQELLAARGVRLIVVMAPDKVDGKWEQIPAIWKFVYKHDPVLADSYFPFYEQSFNHYGIDYVNCLDTLADPHTRAIAFTDRGTHWSMYGAALCLSKMAANLHKIDASAFPAVTISGAAQSVNPLHEEHDIANLLNIYPRYSGGRPGFYLANIDKSAFSVPCVFIGDSFSGQMMDNMLLCGYSTKGEIKFFINHTPSKEDFIKAVDSSKVLIIICNSQKFLFNHIIEMLRPLIGYLETSPAPQHGSK